MFKKDPKKYLKKLKSPDRLVSILSSISKLFNKSKLDQIASIFENIFSKYQFSFRKANSAQQFLIFIVISQKIDVENKEVLKTTEAPLVLC